MLRLYDGTQVRVRGLDEILSELYAEGRKVNSPTAEEILDRLEKSNNYIPASARREYKGVLLKEYQDYVASRREKPGGGLEREGKMSQEEKVNEFLNWFRGLSREAQKEVLKKLIPEFCETAMRDWTFVQEMMPRCMEMMKGMDSPVKEMMSRMMGKFSP